MAAVLDETANNISTHDARLSFFVAIPCMSLKTNREKAILNA
jgi:hypothetical protein